MAAYQDPRAVQYRNKAESYHYGRGVQKSYSEAFRWYVKAAELGDPQAQNMVGRYYEEGWNGEKNQNKAVIWFRNAANQGLAVAQYNLATKLRTGTGTAQSHQEAFRWYKAAADQNYAAAQNMVGRYYEEGWAGTQNMALAVEWFRRAAEQGHAAAQHNLALRYRLGDGIQQSHSEAFRWYMKAAEQEHLDAMNMVGRYYEEGWNGEKDLTKAVTWYRKAAEKGLAVAQYNLAVRLRTGTGVAKDHTEAFRWYKAAAEQGHLDAMNMLGRYYAEGWAGTKNLEEAVRWYRKAAEQGQTAAQYNLAICYKNGEGVAQSHEEAFRWYRKAADQGDTDAQNMMGRYYEEGWAGPKDLTEAVSWYRKAAEGGLAVAQYNLGLSYKNGEGVAEDRQEALRWFRKAAEQGHEDAKKQVALLENYTAPAAPAAPANPNEDPLVASYREAAEKGNVFAQFNLAWRYEQGEGVARDIEQALYWYNKAAEQGDADAKAALERLKNAPPEPAQPVNQPAAPGNGSAPAAPSAPQDESLEGLLAKLDNMVGLESVKAQVHAQVAKIQVENAARRLGVHRRLSGGSRHMVFAGNPGTGKTTVARLIGKIYAALGVLPKGDVFVECSRDKLVAQYIGETAINVQKKIEEAKGGILFIDEAYSLYKEGDPKDFGKEAIETLMKYMEDYRDQLLVIMAGYTELMQDMINNANPGLASRIGSWVNFEDYSQEEMKAIFYGMVRDANMKMEEGCDEALTRLIAKHAANPKFGNARGVRGLFDKIVDQMDLRLAQTPGASAEDYVTIRVQDVQSALGEDDEEGETLQDLLDQLDAMTGLEKVKQQIHRRVDQVQMDERARKAGSLRRSDATSLHMVFAGNPGTGKTTIARLVGKIYRKLGILKGDDIFVECSRETLVGQYIGETAQLVRRKVESALGGILFIDEAYSLYRADDPKDFGREAIDTLIKYMEDYRENLVIIMAGYTELMANMIDNANPGLASRFRIWIEFEDYTPEEMCEIFRKMVKDRNCRLEPEADDELTSLIERCSAKEGFGNARGVRNLLELVLEKLNERIARRFEERLPVTKEDFDTVREEDLLSAMEEIMAEMPEDKPEWRPPRIGF